MHYMSDHGLRRHSRGIAAYAAMMMLAFTAIVQFGCAKKGVSEEQDAAVIDRAEELLALYDFDEAYKLLTPHLGLMEEGTPEWARALYLHSMAGWQSLPPSRGRIEDAREAFHYLAEKAPASTYAPMALRNLGRMAELRTYPGDVMDTEKARDYYQRVLEGWPGTLMAHEAAARLAGTYIQDVLNVGSIQKGVTFLEDYLEQYPNNELAGLMWEYLAETRYLMLDDKEGALLALINADKAGWVDPNKTLMNLWRMANLAEELGQVELAVSAYRRVIIEHTRGGRSWEARQRLLALRDAHPEYRISLPETLAVEE